MPVDSPTADGGVPRPEETGARGAENQSGASGVNESQIENGSSNTNAASEKGAIGSLIVAVFSFAAMTMGMDPSELQLQQPKTDADSGHLQTENENKSLSNETAGSTEGNSSGHGNQTKGKKSDVKMKKQILDAGSLLTATVGLNAKMKQHTIIEMEDNISSNVKDDVIPPDLKKLDEVQIDNKSPKGTKRLAKHAVENSALPIKAASHQQLLDAFENNRKSIVSEKLEEQREKVSGSNNFMESALNVPWKTGTVALVTSLKTQAEESGLKNEIEISTADSETQQNGSTESDNKVKPFKDASPQSTTSGSEDGSELARKVNADGKRRESFSFKAVAWALATMTMHPPVKIKVTPKDQQEENISLQDLSSSVSEQDKSKFHEHESDDVTGNSMNKSPRQNETPDKSNTFIEDDAKPGPSRMAKMVVGGPEKITPADFDDSNDDDGKTQKERITTLMEEEPGKLADSTSAFETHVGISRTSRATQTENVDEDASILRSGNVAVGMTKPGPGCFGHIMPSIRKRGKEDELQYQRRLPRLAAFPGEIKITTNRDQHKLDDSVKMAAKPKTGFLGRIKDFMNRRGERTPTTPDVENQLEAISTCKSLSDGTDGSVFLTGSDENHELEGADKIEMNEIIVSGDNTKSPACDKHQAQAEVIVKLENDNDPHLSGLANGPSNGHSSVSGNLEKVITEQPKKTLHMSGISGVNQQQPPTTAELNDTSMHTSCRATQTDDASINGQSDEPTESVKQMSNYVAQCWKSMAENEVNMQFEETIKCDAKLGFSTFTVDDDGELQNTKCGKARFILIMLLAMFNVWKEIRKVFWYMEEDKKKKEKDEKEKEKSDHTFWYVNIAFQSTICLLLVAHFVLIWWSQPAVGKAVKGLRRTRPPTNNKSRFSAKGLRMFSIITGVLLIFSGGTVLKQANDYSIERVWIEHEFELYESVVPGALARALAENEKPETNTTTPIGWMNGSMANSSWPNLALINSTTINSTIIPKNETEPNTQKGFFIKDGNLETLIFGTISVVLDLIGQITFTSAFDYLIVIGFIIWRYVDTALRVDHLTLKDKDGNPLSPEELEMRKVLAKKVLADYDEFMVVTAELNNVGKMIWPALLLTAIFMLSYLIHLVFLGNWFESMYYILHVSKIFVIFYIGMKIAHRVDKYFDWFVSEDARILLELDHHDFDRRNYEIKRRPIALGMGPTIVSLKFIFGFFGIVSSNVILLIQSFFAQGHST